MMAFPGMIVSAAEKAGMPVPPNPDDFDPNDFPHFQVFCYAQLGRGMKPGEHWSNAEVIAGIPDDEIRSVTFADLIDRGLEWQS